MANVNTSGAGPSSLYTIRTNRIETKSRDAPSLHESTGLTNEPRRSADFNIEVGDPIQLDTPSAHGSPRGWWPECVSDRTQPPRLRCE